jgi:hypothetical protein
MSRLSTISHGTLDELDYILEGEDGYLDPGEMMAAIQRVLREVRRVDGLYEQSESRRIAKEEGRRP